MNLKSKGIKDFISVFGDNMLVMLVGIMQAVILPKFLSPLEYGYWSKYLLYISYAGLFGLGICDGIYLVYGGKSYESLNYDKFKAIYYFHFYYSIILLILWCLICLTFFSDNVEDLCILLGIGLSSICAIYINLVTGIQQATSRFDIYSKGHIIEKIFIGTGIILAVVFKLYWALLIVGASIVGRVVTIVYYFYYEKPILNANPNYTNIGSDLFEYAKIGLFLTLAALGQSAMSGIGRFVIEGRFGIEQLGYYSFVFSIAGLFSQFFIAVATVIFPSLRNKESKKGQSQMVKIDDAFNYLGGFILLLYFPCRLCIEVFFPKYQLAMDCMIVLFPLIVLQGKMSIVYNTVYKVFRKERHIVYNLAISLLICVLAIVVGLQIENSLISIAVSTFIAFVVWSFISVYVARKLNVGHYPYGICFMISSIVFVFINVKFGFTWQSFYLSVIVVLPYIVFKTNSFVKLVKNIVKR